MLRLSSQVRLLLCVKCLCFSSTGATACFGQSLQTLSATRQATSCTSPAGHEEVSQILSPLVVCGPSGAGKGTIIEKFMSKPRWRAKFSFGVSHTTREPRSGEKNGVHYNFVSVEEMKDLIRNKGFLEWAEVHGNFYGTSRKAVEDVQNDGKQCLLDLDVQGVKSLKQLKGPTLQPKFVFIAPPSLEILETRLRARGTESEEALQKRTSNARDEVAYGSLDGNFDDIVINDNLEEAVTNFEKVISSLYAED